MPNQVIIKANGPLVFQGNIRLENADGDMIASEKEMFLCRCGHSSNKPFCDGAHKKHSFEDGALVQDKKPENPEGEGELVITVRHNAMLIAKGPMYIRNTDNISATTRNKAAFCRCGHSANKPFCDASHKLCGFTD